MALGRLAAISLLALVLAGCGDVLPGPVLELAQPGELSSAHAFIGDECGACHVAVEGIARERCVACHAHEPVLLDRQPTRFHLDVENCEGCHGEHGAPLTRMDHEALAAELMAREAVASAESRVVELARMHRREVIEVDGMSPEVWALACVDCHKSAEPHFEYFGVDCAACHGTEAWTIPAYVHPAADTTECAQCHAAPPSHYMGHFGMISQRVAGRPRAAVRQCYACHETTSWNDIRGTGFYKHH